MATRLKELREGRRWTKQQAADAMGVSYGQYVKLERGERRLTAAYIESASRAFGVSKAEILDAPETIPLMGYVGAGGFIEWSTSQGPFDEVPIPPGGTPNMVAVQVRGESMPPLEDGWLLYYDDIREEPTPDMLQAKAPVVVQLIDGRAYVKRIRKGSRPRRFHLVSTAQHHEPILDAEVQWVARVVFIKPSWDKL